MVSPILLNPTAKITQDIPYLGRGDRRSSRRSKAGGYPSLDMNYYSPLRYNTYNPYYYPPMGYGPGMYAGYYYPYMNYGMPPRYSDYYPNLLL